MRHLANECAYSAPPPFAQGIEGKSDVRGFLELGKCGSSSQGLLIDEVKNGVDQANCRREDVERNRPPADVDDCQGE